jgi:pSer/pThr/pTyr-binding forkhead associated (FHA) protein
MSIHIVIKQEGISDLRCEIEEELIIGRSKTCGLPLTDRRISRRHLRLWRDGELYYAEDLGSTHGTSLNGAPLRSVCTVHAGDVFTLGEVELHAVAEREDYAEGNPSENRHTGGSEESTQLADSSPGSVGFSSPNDPPSQQSQSRVLSSALLDPHETAFTGGKDSIASAADSGATEFAAREEGAETRFADWVRDSDDDEENKTRVVMDAPTRMVDPADLPVPQERKRKVASPHQTNGKDQSRKARIQVIIGMFAVFLLMLFVLKTKSRGETWEVYRDPPPREAFSLSVPSAWKRVQRDEAELCLLHPDAQDMTSGPVVSLWLRRGEEYLRRGYSLVVREICAEWEAERGRTFQWKDGAHESATRYSDGVKVETMNFQDAQTAGTLLILPDRESVWILEARAPLDRINQMRPLFKEVIQSFRYRSNQFFIDIPSPNEQQIVTALTEPERLRRTVERLIRIGDELSAKASAYPGNRAEALRAYREALTWMETLTDKPAEHATIIDHLIREEVAYRNELRRLHASLQSAMSRKKWKSADEILQNIMQTVGDKTSEDYQRAYRSHMMFQEKGTFTWP